MKKTTILCKNISKTFGEGPVRVTILKNVNWAAVQAEMIMLMGPSGSGKTTLLSIIGGILSPTTGSCYVLGQNMNEMPEADRTAFRGKHIGFLFQNFNLVPTLNAIENTALPLMLNGVKWQDAFAQAEQFLAKLGLDSQRYRLPGELSGGEQQRVALARACIHQPDIILCDEPTSFLDRARGLEIMTLLTDIKMTYNCTIIIVTHDPRILSFADRILEIEDGMVKEKIN